MEIAIVGINYEVASIDIREKVSFAKSKKIEASEYLLNKNIDEVVILSTCNRSEIYIASDNIEEKIEIVKELYKEFSGIENIDKYIFYKKEEAAVIYIYNVAAGLNSMILCEDQILGQVKDAMQFSIENGYSKKILNKLFREAVTTAKNIKNTLKISENPISLVYIAIKCLKSKLDTLKGKKACVIGMGEMGKLAVNHLLEENLEKIYVANRNYKNIECFIDKYPNVIPIEFEKRYSTLQEVDIVITATSAPHMVIEYEKLLNVNINKEIYIMDLALPRDVDKKVNDISSIHLYDIDYFNNISENNMRKRHELCKAARCIIEESTKEFFIWKKEIKIDFVIKALNQRCTKIKQEKLDYIYKKVNLNEKDKDILNKALESALKNILKEPILNLKKQSLSKDIDNYIHVINVLFDIKKEQKLMKGRDINGNG